jgi:hypothetical protein
LRYAVMLSKTPLAALVSVLAAAAALFLPAHAFADCIDIPNLLAELPPERVTPNQTTLAFSYDIRRSEYSVIVSRGGREFAYAALPLQRNCHPGTLRWESDEFVLLERGCGTFCWGVEALGTTDQRRQSIFRPIHFDSARHMVISYPEWDTIAVRSLISGYEQTIPTARHCESSAEICFEPRLEGDSIVYAWQDGARYAVPLDETLIN